MMRWELAARVVVSGGDGPVRGLADTVTLFGGEMAEGRQRRDVIFAIMAASSVRR